MQLTHTAFRLQQAAIALIASCVLAESVSAETLPADLILDNADIYTPNGWAQALAIKDGVIIATGTSASVAPYRSTNTRTIDLKGAAVLPGLHDLHVHPLMAGQTQLQCMFAQGSPLAQVQTTLAGCVRAHAKDEWIVGGQWDAASLGAPPDRKALDAFAPDNPVAFTDISLHGLWVNSKALQIAGITAKTPNPPGGIIERDANGEPTGVLRESAGGLVRQHIPAYTPEQNAKALSWSMQHMLSFGITSFTDALVDDAGLRAYATLADRGELKQRVRGCMAWTRSLLSGGNEQDPDYIALRNLYARERFAPTCIKILLDGVPTDGHTAAMVSPYADVGDPKDVRARGLLMVPPQTLNRTLTTLDAQGFVVKMHAAGDAAVRAGLDAIAAARKANGFSGQLHEVAHNSFVQLDDIKRARSIAATFEFSPYIWFPNPIIPDIQKAVGTERMQRWIPVKDALDAGALVVAGSDWSVVPSVNPWIAVETLVTRRAPGGGGELLGASQRISLEQAIALFTANAARETGERTKIGTLERGMLADLVVLDRNPFKIPVTDIHNTRVKMTLINGETVYQSADGAAAPERRAIEPQITPLPTVQGPISVSKTSWPFAAADHSVTARDLSKDGYVEEEYFLSGSANVYDWPALGKLTSFARGPYTTRILVRRPKSAARFSGTVIVEALNPSIRYDAAVMWMESQDYIMRSGHAYVGVTVKPVAVASLKLFDSQRYAPLSFGNPLPVEQTCPQSQLPPAPGGLPPESTPATENGLIWDILSQTGALLHSASEANPLRSFKVSRVYLTGDSQSGGFVLNYANAIHPFALRSPGAPVYDGYLTSSASGVGLPMHQCAARIPPGDPRLTIQPRGVPIIKIINQTDIAFLNRRPDSDSVPDLYRSYEVAGAAHVHDWVLAWGANDADVARTGAAGFLSNAGCKQRGERGNQFPTQYILNGAFANLDRWSREGVPPPRAEPLQVGDLRNGRASLELDEHGNARGGVRMPYVDVPLVRYGVYMDGPGICELWGYQVPLEPAVLKRLYPQPSDYVSKVKAATQRSLDARWILPEDAAATVKEAKTAALRNLR